MIDIPTLLPLSVPWMVATSAPNVRIHASPDGKPTSVTFVAYFKLADDGRYTPGSPVDSKNVPDFKVLDQEDHHPYHLVRINFDDGLAYRTHPAISDGEVIRESDYDWSMVPGALLPGEDALDNVRRARQFWIDHQLSPNPGIYIVDKSPWLDELKLGDSSLKHFLILGQDEYIETIARSGMWEVGQAVF